MTWIIGSPNMFGYAAGVSDVQVSWGNGGQRHDCLRKVYEVAPFIAAGFAGSVRLGFQLLQDLTLFLSPPPLTGESWIPRWVAWRWHRRARRLFRSSPESEQKLGSAIILMGVRPTDNSGCVSGGRPDVLVLSHTHGFEPKFTELGEVVSIGSGNDVDLYKNELQALQANFWTQMHGEIGSPGGMGRYWANTLARFLLANPAPGISRNIHYVEVRRNQVRIEPLNQTRISADGTETVFKMPAVASGWWQFAEFAKKNGLCAAEARG